MSRRWMATLAVRPTSIQVCQKALPSMCSISSRDQSKLTYGQARCSAMWASSRPLSIHRSTTSHTTANICMIVRSLRKRSRSKSLLYQWRRHNIIGISLVSTFCTTPLLEAATNDSISTMLREGGFCAQRCQICRNDSQSRCELDRVHMGYGMWRCQ